MNVLKFRIFNSDDFVAWQQESERKIYQVSPFIGNLMGDLNDNGKIDFNTNCLVFVLYWE